MRILLTHFVELASRKVRTFDLHEDFGLAYLVEDCETVRLYLAEKECCSWERRDYPYLHHIRWFGKREVIAWCAAGWETAIISKDNWRTLAIGSPDHLLLSKNYIFVSYDDQSPRSQSEILYKKYAVCAFSRDGTFQLGCGDLLIAQKDKEFFIDIDAGYTIGDHLIFVTSAPSWLWDLDTQRLILKRVFIPFSTVALLALAGDEKKAFGILDNRSLQSYYPDLVPFEFAVFDLQAETATRKDFAPIEKEL